jgi:Icc-related predicted phosphoesterase
MVRILAIGDPHGALDKVKKIPTKGIDLILLTGDLGSANLARKMAFENIERKRKGLEEKEFSSNQRKRAFMEAYNSSMKVVRYLSKKSPVYTIYGNIESRNPETRRHAKDLGLELPFLTNDLQALGNVRVINNRIANFRGIRIGGLDYFVDTNWVQDFKPSEYKERLASAKKQTDKARGILKRFNNLDILVCHQPPYGILDRVSGAWGAPKHWRGKNAGSKVILDYIKRKSPKYVFCGHIHEGEGSKKVGKTEVYNLGVCGYKVIEL